MANYLNNPTFDSTDKNRSQSPTLPIFNLLNMDPSSISTNRLKISKILKDSCYSKFPHARYIKTQLKSIKKHQEFYPKSKPEHPFKPISSKHEIIQNQTQNLMFPTSNNHNLTTNNFYFNRKKRFGPNLSIRSKALSAEIMNEMRKRRD